MDFKKYIKNIKSAFTGSTLKKELVDSNSKDSITMIALSCVVATLVAYIMLYIDYRDFGISVPDLTRSFLTSVLNMAAKLSALFGALYLWGNLKLHKKLKNESLALTSIIAIVILIVSVVGTFVTGVPWSTIKMIVYTALVYRFTVEFSRKLAALDAILIMFAWRAVYIWVIGRIFSAGSSFF